MNTHFKIIVAGYNCFDMAQDCFDSIKNQTYINYQVCVVDDASTDPRQPSLVKEYCEANGWLYLLRPFNVGALRSQYEGICLMDPQDGDVIVWVDMDDKLSSELSLEKLDSYYEQDTPMTYGSYSPVPYIDTCPTPARYPMECELANDYRRMHKLSLIHI